MNHLIEEIEESGLLDSDLLQTIRVKVLSIVKDSSDSTMSKLQEIADEHNIPLDNVNDVYSSLVNLPLLD